MHNYSRHFNIRKTPQSQPIPRLKMSGAGPGREPEQVKNDAGGYVFQLDDWNRLDRFLVLGSSGGTYYVSERKLTLDSAACVQHCLEADSKRAINRIVEISEAGRAPGNDPALFALAIAAASPIPDTNTYALLQLPRVARTGTHLFHFAEYVNSLRGWGRGLRTAIERWYVNKPDPALAYQLLKYQARDGWSHRDLIRLAHVKPRTLEQEKLFAWATRSKRGRELPDSVLIRTFEKIKDSRDKDLVVEAMRQSGLTREMIPTWFLNDKEIWRALDDVGIPLGALIRNLGNLSKCGLLIQGQYEVIDKVISRITDQEAIKHSRLHPLDFLKASLTYSQGCGVRGQGSWPVVPKIVDGLNEAFYKSFANVEPTGKRFCIGIDISGSMSHGVAGIEYLPCIVAALALALVTFRVETMVSVVGFTTKPRPIPISSYSTLVSLGQWYKLNHIPEGTDCSVPFDWAITNKVPTDIFVLITDGETWAGSEHPVQSLNRYRRAMGIESRLVVVAMTPTGSTIADPKDPFSLNVVGFDTVVPGVIQQFALGEF